MDSELPNDKQFKIHCDNAKVIFRGLYRDTMLQPQVDESNRRMNETIARLAHANDHRAISIVSALALEGAVDETLKAFAPGYVELYENRDLTFSLKVEFLKSLALMPPHILEAIAPVRKIRNEFGHNIHVRVFEDLDRRFTDSLAHHLGQIAPDSNKATTVQEKLRDLTWFLIMALSLYRQQIAQVREFIGSKAFWVAFKKTAPKPNMSEGDG